MELQSWPMLYAAMEYIVFAVILYFILQTMGNLVLIVRGKEANRKPPTMPDGWEGPMPRRYTGQARNHPRFWGEDIQRAQWVDLDDTAQ
jgi:hypothetical protein